MSARFRSVAGLGILLLMACGKTSASAPAAKGGIVAVVAHRLPVSHRSIPAWDRQWAEPERLRAFSGLLQELAGSWKPLDGALAARPLCTFEVKWQDGSASQLQLIDRDQLLGDGRVAVLSAGQSKLLLDACGGLPEGEEKKP